MLWQFRYQSHSVSKFTQTWLWMHWCIAYYITLHATDLSFFPCRNEKKVNDSPTLTNYTAAAESTFCVLLFFAQFFVRESQKWVCCSRFFTSTASLPTNPVCLGRCFSLSLFCSIQYAHYWRPHGRNRKQSTSLQSNMKVDIKWVCNGSFSGLVRKDDFNSMPYILSP